MARRYRWLKAQWPISMKTLGRRLKAKEFNGDATHGFVIDRLRDDLLEARYVERVEYTETITDPFGKELSSNVLNFAKAISVQRPTALVLRSAILHAPCSPS